MALAVETEEAHAIRALGSLFKLTEVYLWDGASIDVPEVSPVIILDDSLTETSSTLDCCKTSCSKVEPTIEEFTASLEDMELIRQMDALGLPTSFNTNRESRAKTKNKEKRKSVQERFDHTAHKNIKEEPSDGFRGSEGEAVCSSEISRNNASRSMDGIVATDHCEKPYYNVANNSSQSDLPSGDTNGHSFEVCIHSGDWRVIWDDCYMRNYFYNVKTHVTTWYPPPGMEHLVFSDSAVELNGLVTDAVEKVDIDLASDDIKVLDICELQDKTHTLLEVGNYDSVTSGVLCVQSIDIENLESDMSLLDEHQGNKCTSFPFSCKNSDELEGHVGCQEVKNICDSSSSVIQDNIGSLQGLLSELGSEDVWRSDLQLAFMNSKTDEQDDHGHLYEREGNASSHEEMNGEVLQVPPLDSLGATVTEELYEGNWGSNMLQKHINPAAEESDECRILTATKRKRKVRTRVRRKMISDDIKELSSVPNTVEGLSADIIKYWCQRYLLFSKFDEGVKLDKEGWFSVTPEPVAMHHASRCGGGTIIDCFTGVGGNAIQFAKRSDHVIGIDIDPQKIDYAQHNAMIYGVDDRIDFIKGDFFHFAPMLKADTVYMSPPWGGPDYAKVQTYDIRTMLKPHGGTFLFEIARMIACRIVMFLPRNVDLNQLAEMSLLVHPPWALEVEKNFLNGKLKAITAYFHSTEAAAFC